MAHELDFSRGSAAIAYAQGDVPWHGLGRSINPDSSIEEWKKAAYMDWEIQRSMVQFSYPEFGPATGLQNPLSAVTMKHALYEDKHVLFRSDTKAPLSVVSPSYKIVQPGEVLEFYQDLTDTMGFQLETAGVLFGGRRFWALANTEHVVELAGQDKVKGYLLLTTSCDGTLATTAQFTSIRVVCNNTLSVAVKDNNEKIRVPHNKTFAPSDVKRELGLVDAAWLRFQEKISVLSETEVDIDQAGEYLVKIFGDPEVPSSAQNPAVADKCNRVWSLFCGKGRGANLDSADGTFWGLLNAVTQTIDYHTDHRTVDARLNNAWYGAGNKLKTLAFDTAFEMATNDSN